MMKNLMMDKEFIKSLKLISKEDIFDIQGMVTGDLMDYYILTPLRKKHKGDFVSFLLDFSS